MSYPVVLIHGALRSRLGLVPTMAYLRSRGLDARPFGYATRRDTLETHAAKLAEFLDAWLKGRDPAERLGVLTHSFGGLVARAYLASDAAARHARSQRVVMLAPPNQGAQLAARNEGWPPYQWFYGAAADALLPRNARQVPLPPPTCEVLILAGGRGVETGINPKIQGDDDGLVAVAETALPGVDPVLVGGVHSTLQWRPDVLSAAATFLLTGEKPRV